MSADTELYDAAVSLIERRLSANDWATAAALRFDDGSIKVGICLDNFSSAAGLCAEVGPICEAFTTDEKVIASLCVNRIKDRQDDLVLAPCGLCQERLALWGPDVQVGVADAEAPGGWRSRRLADLNPYYWATAFFEDGHWPTAVAEHSD